ncbi:MAG: hypothetical protein WCI22_07285 [Actinomycetota bacterium]
MNRRTITRVAGVIAAAVMIAAPPPPARAVSARSLPVAIAAIAAATDAAAVRFSPPDTRATNPRPPTTVNQLRYCPATGLSTDIRGTRLRLPAYSDRPTVLQMSAPSTAPLVVVFHGRNSCIEMIQSQTDLALLAPNFGVNILWLSGKPTPTRAWNADDVIPPIIPPVSPPGKPPYVDDYPYIAAAIDAAYAAAALRPSAVVSTGISNGAGMSIAAACHFPSRFTLVVAVAGWVPPHCPRMNMTLVTIGGTADAELGAVKAATNADQWRSWVMVGCQSAPDIARYVTSTITTWTCAAGRYVKLVQLNDVPHVWPTYDFYDADTEILRVAHYGQG